MPVNFGFDNPLLKTWLLLHQTYNLVLKCEDATFAKEGLTTQQHAVLIAIKYISDPVTLTGVSSWLDRRINSISLIVDRMEKGGWVKRTRGLRDRRSVRLVITKKGKEVLEQATISGWGLTKEILSNLSEEELRTLTSLLERIRVKAFKYLNPGEVMEEIKTNETENMPRFMASIRRRESRDRLSGC